MSEPNESKQTEELSEVDLSQVNGGAALGDGSVRVVRRTSSLDGKGNDVLTEE